MKAIVNFPSSFRRFSVLMLVLLSGLTGCIHQDEVSPALPITVSGSSLEAAGTNARATSNSGDYTISLSVDGLIWTYCITKKPGAKDVSNFSINLQNCGPASSTINNIVWATVNGKPATLASSNGKNGCDIASVTTNFVKFDNLPAASTYKIVFKTDRAYGNFVTTTAWLKAGTSCHPYAIIAPCCPL